MDQPIFPVQPQDPVELLLADIVEEAMIEVIANKDSELFWAKLKDHLFESALVDFEESYKELIVDLGSHANAFDYFIRFIQRMIVKPYFTEALKKINSVNTIVNNSPDIKNLVVVKFENGDAVKQLCYMLAIYANIISYRLTVLSVDQGAS